MSLLDDFKKGFTKFTNTIHKDIPDNKIFELFDNIARTLDQNYHAKKLQIKKLNEIEKSLHEMSIQNIEQDLIISIDDTITRDANINHICQSLVTQHDDKDIFFIANDLLKQNQNISIQYIKILNEINHVIKNNKEIKTTNEQKLVTLNKINNNMFNIRETFEHINNNILTQFNTLIGNEKSISLSFPRNDSFYEFPTGITIINVVTGQILLPNRSSEFLSKNLESYNIEFAKSFRINTNKLIRVKTDTDEGWYAVSSNDYLQRNFISFKKIILDVFEPTNISFFANSNPSSLIKNDLRNTIVSNDPILVFDEYSGNSDTYQLLAEFVLDNNMNGYINDISLGVALHGESYANFRLIIDNKIMFNDKKCIGQILLSYLKNLKFNHHIRIFVKSNGVRNIIANASITGTLSQNIVSRKN